MEIVTANMGIYSLVRMLAYILKEEEEEDGTKRRRETTPRSSKIKPPLI